MSSRVPPPPNRVRRWTAALAGVFFVALGASVRAGASDGWRGVSSPVFRNITHDTGLPSGTEPEVFAQDALGFMWAGSQSGLVRWDGYRFLRYVADPKGRGALPDSYITSLYNDAEGRLWIGADVGGLVRYDRAHDQFVRVGVAERLARTSVAALLDDGAGGLWVGSEDGLDRWNPRSGRLSHVSPTVPAGGVASITFIKALLRDARGDLWIAAAEGLFRRGAQGGFERVGLPAPALDHHQATPLALFEDSRRRIWVGTSRDGAFVMAPGSAAPTPFVAGAQGATTLTTERVTSIAESTPGQIWLGTQGEGVFVFDSATGRGSRLRHELAVPSSLSDDTVLRIVRDRSGLMWVATNRGFSLYNPLQTAFVTAFGPAGRTGGLTAGDISSVAEAPDGRIWLGLGSAGVDIVGRQSGVLNRLRPDPRRPQLALPTSYVDALAPTREGPVYLGTGRGLYRTDPQARTATHVALPVDDRGEVRALLARPGELWVGAKGLTRLRLGADGVPRGAPEHLEAELPDGHVSALLGGPDGAIWVGTHQGLARVGSDLHVLETIVPGAGLRDLHGGGITSLLTDRSGRLWVGESGGAIDVLVGRDAQGRPRFRHLGTESGLPNDNVDQMLMGPDGDVWVSTDDGLARVDPATFAITPMQGRDGVNITTYWTRSGAVTSTGELLFGGVGGLTIVRPKLIEPWRYRPPVVVTDVERGGRAVLPAAYDPGFASDAFAIQPNANQMRFEFASLDYAGADSRYAYRLEGYDPQWIVTDAVHRVAAYTNLAPGRYTLRLRSSNKDGVWSGRELTIPVVVLPAWWQTALFRILCALATLALISTLILWRTAALRRQKRALEHQVADRTARLSEQTELALAANQAKSTFLAMMSHELRTPMNGVLGMAQALQLTRLDEAQARDVDMLVQSGHSLMRILNDILDISKIEAGRLELDCTTFDLLEVGQTAHDLWSHIATDKGVALLYNVDPAAPRWVEGDSTRVRQILLNLVSNALKFTEQGEVRLEIASAPGGVRLAVRDTGIGMTPAQQTGLFQSFTQAEASTSRRFGGTGLGLSICRQLTELMDGRIEVQSAEGVGSEFVVFLPLREASAPVVENAPETVLPAAPLAGAALLVVDDNAVNRAVAGAVLGAVGADITSADGGERALDLLRNARFDLVLMDLHMPGMDGVQAVKEIRAGRAGRIDVPVIALTADVMAGSDTCLLELGFDAVQSKPISAAALIGAVCAAIATAEATPSRGLEPSAASTGSLKSGRG